MLEYHGFKALVGTQCMYVQPKTGLVLVAYADDLLVLRQQAQLKGLLKDLGRDFECTGQVLGYGSDCARELEFLGRVSRLCSHGVEWEGDPKHAHAHLDQLRAELCNGVGSSFGVRPVQTPGVKLHEVPERTLLKPAAAKAYRGLVALLNYMSLDRCDLAFASKEVSKTMFSPAECDLIPLKRIGRCLVDHLRCVTVY